MFAIDEINVPFRSRQCEKNKEISKAGFKVNKIRGEEM